MCAVYFKVSVKSLKIFNIFKLSINDFVLPKDTKLERLVHCEQIKIYITYTNFQRLPYSAVLFQT